MEIKTKDVKCQQSKYVKSSCCKNVFLEPVQFQSLVYRK